jgi:cytochrome P450
MTGVRSSTYYDPYDFEIDADPYPVWKRLRDEAPLYCNEEYDFYALSRFDDVDSCLRDWQTYIPVRVRSSNSSKLRWRCRRAYSSSKILPSTIPTGPDSEGSSRPVAS